MIKVGWRLVEIEEGNQVKLSEVLAKLPSRTYRNVKELISGLKSIKQSLLWGEAR